MLFRSTAPHQKNYLSIHACNRHKRKTCRVVSQSCEVNMPRCVLNRLAPLFVLIAILCDYAVTYKRCDLVNIDETGETQTTFNSLLHLEKGALGVPTSDSTFCAHPFSNVPLKSRFLVCTDFMEKKKRQMIFEQFYF